MVGKRQRRIPERHDGVAHIFVDGAALAQDDVAQWRQQLVDELRQRRGAHAFGNAGEVADIAEHQREFAHLAAKFEPRRIGDDFLNHRRREIASESAADGAALLFRSAGRCRT